MHSDYFWDIISEKLFSITKLSCLCHIYQSLRIERLSLATTRAKKEIVVSYKIEIIVLTMYNEWSGFKHHFMLKHME